MKNRQTRNASNFSHVLFNFSALHKLLTWFAVSLLVEIIHCFIDCHPYQSLTIVLIIDLLYLPFNCNSCQIYTYCSSHYVAYTLNSVQHSSVINSTYLKFIHFQFLFMFINKIMLSNDGIMGCIIPMVFPSCKLC